MTTTTVQKPESPRLPVSGLLLLILALAAIGVAWGLQLSRGMQVTGLGQQITWGLYIAGFFTAAGAGGGLVTLAALSEFTPAIPTAYRRNMLLLALASFVAAGVLIAMDLGHPLNTWRIAIAGRFDSLMTWDFWALSGSGLLALVYLTVVWRTTASTGTTRVVGVLAALAALALLVAESWMLAVLVARPFWGGGQMLLNFLAAGAVGALALGVLAWKDLAPRFGRWLALALGVSLVLVLAEALTLLVSVEPRAAEELGILLLGSVSSVFWLHVVLGLILPLAMLIWSRGASRPAALLALLGVVAHKLWLLVVGQTVPWLDLPQASYWPTWIEYLGLAGAAALVAALYIGFRHLAQLDERK
ncbi:MAG: NrfD/PsrC family molybdoenzyme membrane anchor subunit [Chloroflexota bacterium]